MRRSVGTTHKNGREGRGRLDFNSVVGGEEREEIVCHLRRECDFPSILWFFEFRAVYTFFVLSLVK